MAAAVASDVALPRSMVRAQQMRMIRDVCVCASSSALVDWRDGRGTAKSSKRRRPLRSTIRTFMVRPDPTRLTPSPNNKPTTTTGMTTIKVDNLRFDCTSDELRNVFEG